ncbi:hypothetical protein EV182_006684 [Spiromyces aspiralis]|uniref:Uncharacterized protein n=1 Tax=Spiromyces aspiralis TaxID=68401 RepID=A0ACC1HAJ8_9FUNG|nr:hypothetical protein EV182_006684 [Spiromyces aspiralis]
MKTPSNNFRVFVSGKATDFRDLPPDIVKDIRDRVPAVLSANPILPHIAWLQQHLDTLDIEGVYEVYRRRIEDGWTPSQPTLSEWETTLANFTQRMRSGDLQTPSDPQQILNEFLISVTLKDISVFLAFSAGKDSNNNGGSKQVLMAVPRVN